MKIFLGGTCNGSKWRDELIPLLKIDYFNPVVENWTPECRVRELKERSTCDYVLYVISPMMTGVYSIAEAVDDSNKRPNSTLFCVLWGSVNGEAFTDAQCDSLLATERMIAFNGGKVFATLADIANFVNTEHQYNKA